MTRDPLGDRMKRRYERASHVHLPGRTHTVLRVDGRAFHTYTRGLDRPFDRPFLEDMNEVARALCETVQGARLAYAQSDEVSVIYDDLASPTSEAWFDGDLQKIVSVAASTAAVHLQWLRPNPRSPGLLPTFDARAFTIADPVEVVNYLVWRQRDAVRNSIHAAARAHLSHRECEGKTGNELQELLWREHRVNWNDYDPRFRRGTLVRPVTTRDDVHFTDRAGQAGVAPDVERREWLAEAAPTFVVDHPLLRELLPSLGALYGEPVSP